MKAVVIPCFRVKDQILDVLNRIPSEVEKVYVVDDRCPENSGTFVQEQCKDPRVSVIFHEENLGVGGATMTGFRRAIKDGCAMIAKIDGDGQMDPALLPSFFHPIEVGMADYTKGNRFFDLSGLSAMPKIRLFGNAVLSFIAKASSGYWNVMDPTNGYLAIHVKVLKLLPLEKLDRRYFFENDLLFRLNTVRAVVQDVPMVAVYGDEKSSLKIHRVALQFPPRFISRTIKRLTYNYLVRDFNLGTLQFFSAAVLLGFGSIYGVKKWIFAIESGVPVTSGTVMLAALPIILGFQLLLSAIQYEIQNIPSKPLHRLLRS